MDETEFGEIESAVARLEQGDDSAREKLIQLSYDRMTRLARKMLKQFPVVRRWEQTDDVFQQAAVRLWQALEQVQPENSRHYFNLAALQVRRELIDLARKLQGPGGLARNQESVAPKPVSQESGDRASNEEHCETYEPAKLASWGEFHEAVDQLEDDLKEVFQLIWYQGLSQDAVATLLNISQKSVSRRWLKARRELYSVLGRQLPE